jgi:hypothetical protein
MNLLVYSLFAMIGGILMVAVLERRKITSLKRIDGVRGNSLTPSLTSLRLVKIGITPAMVVTGVTTTPSFSRQFCDQCFSGKQKPAIEENSDRDAYNFCRIDYATLNEIADFSSSALKPIEALPSARICSNGAPS